MRDLGRFILIAIGTGFASCVLGAEPDPAATNSTSHPFLTFDTPAAGIWRGAIGEGFQSSVQTLSFAVGAAAGFQAFGGYQDHDLALVSLSYGHMLGPIMGADRWYRGNWEIRGELFGGAEFSPSRESLVGLTPHLRYNLATGTRWIPYIDGGAGVSATSIGPPDLSGTFEFNIQGNTGVHWFVRDDVAVTFQAGYLHMSCAGIHYPNQGLNCVTGLIGITWFF